MTVVYIPKPAGNDQLTTPSTASYKTWPCQRFSNHEYLEYMYLADREKKTRFTEKRKNWRTWVFSTRSRASFFLSSSISLWCWNRRITAKVQRWYNSLNICIYSSWNFVIRLKSSRLFASLGHWVSLWVSTIFFSMASSFQRRAKVDARILKAVQVFKIGYTCQQGN